MRASPASSARSARAVVQLQRRAERALDAGDARIHGQDRCQDLDQPRHAAERFDPKGAGLGRMNAVVFSLVLGTATPGGGFPVYGAAFSEAVNAQEPKLRIETRNTKGSTRSEEHT